MRVRRSVLLVVLTLMGAATPSSHARAASAVSIRAERQDTAAMKTVKLRPGTQRVRFRLRRPAGVVLAFRLTLPLGTRAYLTGRIGSVAGVMISTDSSDCRRVGSVLRCEQQVEWCPLPRGTWGFRLRKVAGPAGQAVLEFRVGTPPHPA